MKQSHEGISTYSDTNTLPLDHENTHQEDTEYHQLLDIIEALARERQQHPEYEEYGEIALLAKERDWATLSDRLTKPHSFAESDIETIKTELLDIPGEESLQILQQLAMHGLITRDEPASSYNPRLSTIYERRAAIKRQAAINCFLDIARQGEDALANALKTPNTRSVKEFFQNLSSTSAEIVTDLAKQNTYYGSNAHRDLPLWRFGINPDQPLSELRHQVAERILTELDHSTQPLRELEQLARLDSQYIAGFIRAYDEFDGVDRDQLITLLAHHDAEQVIHLAKERVIDEVHVTHMLADDHIPVRTRSRLSILTPENIEETALAQIATQLPLTELYQLNKDSERWRELTRRSPLVHETINHQLAQLVDEQQDPISRIDLLNRFAGFGAAESFIAEQKEAAYDELLNQSAAGLPADLDATIKTQLEIRQTFQNYQPTDNVIAFIDTALDDVYKLKNSLTPAEQTRLLENVLVWREHLTPPSNDDEKREVDSYVLDIARELLNQHEADPSHPAYNKSLTDTVLGLAHTYLDEYIASPHYKTEGGVFDHLTLTIIAHTAQNSELAIRLAEHLSPASADLAFINASEQQPNDLDWLQLVSPKLRQSFVDRASNHLAVGLTIDHIFPDDPERKSATLVKVMSETGFGARDFERFRDIMAITENIPSSPREAHFLLYLHKQYGHETTTTILKYLPLHKLRGDNESVHMSIVSEALKSDNIFLARFGIDYFELIQKLPGGYEQWQAIKERTKPYLTARAEAFARPEYMNDFSLLTKYNSIDKETTRERFETEYTLYRDTMLRAWQSQTTGMTNAQIDTVLASLTELGDASLHGYSEKRRPLTLANMADKGYFGPILLEYNRHEQAIRDILGNDTVVGESLKLSNILDSDSIRQTIDVLLQSASELSSSRTDAERYAHIASNVVMQTILEGGDDWRGDVSIPSNAGPVPLSTMTRETYEALAAQTLTRVLEVPIEERNRASAQNIQHARLIGQQGAAFIIPQGSFIHETTGYDGILQGTANLAGEHLGVKNLRTDSFPGFVDLIKTDDEWGDVELGSYDTHKMRYGIGSALVYLPEADITAQPEISSGYHGHHLAFGGIANTKLGLIIDLNDDTDHIEAACQAQVETGLYIPIVDRSGNLLFTPEDYQIRFEALKQYRSLENLVKTDIYTSALYETPDPGGVGSIAEHMERSVAIASELIDQAELDNNTANIILAAMKLHDVGKTSDIAQEISNVTAARDILRQVDELTSEERRQILLLIRHDELIGEVLKSFELNSPGVQAGALPRYAQQKLDQFNRVFENEALRRAAIVVYQADVAAKRPEAWTEWQIPDKLAHIGLPVYPPQVNYYV